MFFEWIKIGIGSLVVLFLPGYWISKCFFRSEELDAVERAVISFALSVSGLSLLTYGVNLAGLPVSSASVLGIIAVIIGASFICLYKHKLFK